MTINNFNEFQDYVISNIKSYLPDEYKDANLSLHDVTKNNDTHLTGISVKFDNTNIAPTIYLNDAYDRYKNGIDINQTLEELAKAVIYAEKLMKNYLQNNIPEITNYVKIQKYIYPKLINADANKSYLQDKPHKYFGDMAVVYYADINNQSVVIITNEIFKEYGITINDLHKNAINNISSCAVCHPLTPFGGPLILSRPDYSNGAAVILSTKILKDIAEKLDEGYYIIPSSVDEVLLLPDSVVKDKNEIMNMIPQVNAHHVVPTQILSDNLYHYDKDAEKVEIV